MTLSSPLAGAAVLLFLAADAARSECSLGEFELRGDWGAASFSVEVADTQELRAEGLMFRESLAPSAGMLFVYESPRRATFWMKNTRIPLDILFFDETGTLTTLHRNAVPFDTSTIDGGSGVAAALEVNAGMADLLGIGQGTVARHPLIDQSEAAWPCGSES